MVPLVGAKLRDSASAGCFDRLGMDSDISLCGGLVPGGCGRAAFVGWGMTRDQDERDGMSGACGDGCVWYPNRQ